MLPLLFFTFLPLAIFYSFHLQLQNICILLFFVAQKGLFKCKIAINGGYNFVPRSVLHLDKNLVYICSQFLLDFEITERRDRWADRTYW